MDEPAALGPAPTAPRRVTDPDGHIVEVFALPTDETSLEGLLRELFEKHWRVITFGPIIQGRRGKCGRHTRRLMSVC